MKYIVLILTASAFSAPSWAASYYVSPLGAGNCTTKELACNSIQRAISLSRAGDEVVIAAGTYIEDSSNSPYTKKCGWFDPQIASLCINSSGEIGKPIVIRAALGDERNVIIDSQNKRLGIQIGANDNLEIKGLKFVHNRGAGIANYGQAQNAIPDDNILSKNVLIKGNTFIDTSDDWGTNPSAIAMWSSQGWRVEDNYIDTVIQDGGRAAAGIMAYGVIEALVINNTIKNSAFGIFWKDHFIKDASRTLYQESEIAYNLIDAGEIGIKISIRGQGSPEAGHNDFHHNIIRGASGIASGMAGAEGVSGNIIIRNNLIDGAGIPGTVGISADSHLSTTIRGNMIFGSDVAFEFPVVADGKSAKLIASDFNIFDTNFQVITDRYSPTTKYFRSLEEWRLAKNDVNTIIKSFKNLTSPDKNSKVLAKADTVNNDYTFKAGSPALKIVNGKNPGPYENGNEIIGASLSAQVSPTINNAPAKVTELKIQ